MAETGKQLDMQENETATETSVAYETYPSETEYTTEEYTDAVQAEAEAEEEYAEDTAETEAEATAAETTDDTEETKTYNNTFAKILGTIGSFLKKLGITSGLGNMFENFADLIDKGTSDKTDEDSADITNTEYIRESLADIDQEELVDSINTDASQIASSGTINQQGDTPADAMTQAISQSAQTNPKETAKAIQVFNDTAEDAINSVYAEDEDAYNQAMANLGSVNKSMVGALYGVLMEGEQSGSHLLLGDTEQCIDSLHVTGVNMTYSEYTSGADVSQSLDIDASEIAKEEHKNIVDEGFAKSQCLQSEDAPDDLRSSTGSYMSQNSDSAATDVADEIFDTENMYQTGMSDIDTKKSNENAGLNMVSASDSFSSMASGALTDEALDSIHTSGLDMSVESVQNVYHDSYAAIINGLTAYNEAAVNEINNRYVSDEDGKQEATDTLADTMRTNVEKVFSSLQADNEALGFLTEEDKENLDNLTLTGVNVKFSNYQNGMNLKTGQIQEENSEPAGEMSAEETELYENASPADAERWANNTQMIDDSTMFTNEDYGQKTARELSGQDEGTKTLEDNLAKAEAEAQAEQAIDNSY